MGLRDAPIVAARARSTRGIGADAPGAELRAMSFGLTAGASLHTIPPRNERPRDQQSLSPRARAAASGQSVRLGCGSLGRRERPRGDCMASRRAPQFGLVRGCGHLLLPGRLSSVFRVCFRQGACPGRHPRHSGGAPRGRPRLCAHQQMGSLRPSLRGDRGSRPARRPDPRRTIRLSSGDALAHRRGGFWGLRPGLYHFVLLDPAGRKIAGRNGARGGKPARRIHRAACRTRDTGDSAGCRRAGHRECAEGVAVGHVHAGNDHPDRHSPRRVSAVFAAGPGARGFAAWSRDGALRGCGGAVGCGLGLVGASVHAQRRHAGFCTDRLRFRRFRAARMAAARPARLFERLHKSRRDFFARRRHSHCPAAHAHAAADSFY